VFDRRTDSRPEGIAGIDEFGAPPLLIPPRIARRGFARIDALIMCNAKDPWSERTTVVPGLKAAIGAKKSVLHHIFTVGDRAGHPGTVSMKPRPKGADGF